MQFIIILIHADFSNDSVSSRFWRNMALALTDFRYSSSVMCAQCWLDYVHTRVFSLFTLLSSLLCLVGNELKVILIPIIDSGYHSTRRRRVHRVEAEEVSSSWDECGTDS